MSGTLRNCYNVTLTVEGYAEKIYAGCVFEETLYAACRDVAHIIEKAKDDDAFLFVEEENRAAIFTPHALKVLTVERDATYEAPPVVDETAEEIRSINEYVAHHDKLMLRRL